jgi:hypothetical protein
MDTFISICLGIGLAASVGFRVFLPLFALSLSSYFNVWELNDSWLWLGSLTALITFGVATLIEIAAYYIPFIDNILDSISIPLAALAGTAVMMSTMVDLSPIISWSLAIIAGGGTAAAISGSSSVTRLTSTTTTGGVGNPIISTIETVTAFFMSVISIFLPLLAIIFVIIILFIIYIIYKKFRPSKS